MLRGRDPGRAPFTALAVVLLVGGAAAALVLLGNPGNMGLCGACFLRDTAGVLGLFAKGPPPVFRPEVAGVLLGALLWVLLRGRYQARSGSYAVARFLLGVFMALGALVFLGCPFRMLQRLGGGDLNALVGAAGLVAGVGVAVLLERRGYTVGKTAPAPAAVGLLGPVTVAGLLVLFLLGGVLLGPGPGATDGPQHAPWAAALGIAAAGGVALSATGFCAVSACRQVFLPGKRMLAAAGVLVLGYAAVTALAGRFAPGFEKQPVAHSEHAWNFLALLLVGLTGAFAGGCPVRQMVMAGEGNGDAFVTVMGLVVGGALAHTLGVASSTAGTTPAGRWVVALGIPLVLAYAVAVTFAARPSPAPPAPGERI